MSDKLKYLSKQLNKPNDTPTDQLLILKPGFTAIVLTSEALQAIENGLIDADAYTGHNYLEQAFSETTTIIKN